MSTIADSASDTTLPVPPLSLSSLGNDNDNDAEADDEDDQLDTTARDDVFESAREAAEKGGGGQGEKVFQKRRQTKVSMAEGTKEARKENVDEATARRRKIFKRAESLDSSISGKTTRSILKRPSRPASASEGDVTDQFDVTFDVTPQPESFAQPLIPLSQLSPFGVTATSFASPRKSIGNITPRNRRGSSVSPRKSIGGAHMDGSVTDRLNRRVSIVRRVSFKGAHSEPPTPHEPESGRRKSKVVSFGFSPAEEAFLDTDRRSSRRSSSKTPDGKARSMRRRDSMMSMLRTELMKNNKLKLPERPALVQSARREKSDETIMWSGNKEAKPPLMKRLSMPSLTGGSLTSRPSMYDDESTISTFDRRKLELLSSLEKMGVKLPKRGQKISNNEEAEIMRKLALRQRHGSLTSRTVLHNFDKSRRPLRPGDMEVEQDRPLDDQTRASLQKIFDTWTQEDAKSVLPGLSGRHRNSLTEQEKTGSTANVFLSRLRRRKKKNTHRFRNLAKFITLLLRAWRTHALAVQAILDVHQSIDVTVDNAGKDALLFDITEYKADTEARVSKKAIEILKKRPKERTTDEIHYLKVALWNYKAIAEYPEHIQRMIAERAWIESYSAKRVIVREGHLPMCFYFVLSGSALVSVMDLDKGVAKTVLYYNRGDSFGEIAIMNKERRQATVISKEAMQLLVLGDEDFVDVFMSGGLNNPDDPFLNSLSYLDGWPKEKLAENPKKANYSYFKRGTTLAKDSLNNDWIIIVKSGSVSLLKKLKNVDPKRALAKRSEESFKEKLAELMREEEQKGLVTHEDRVEDNLAMQQEKVETMGHLARFYALPQIFVDTNEGYNELKRQHDEFTELHGVTALHARDLANTAMSNAAAAGAGGAGGSATSRTAHSRTGSSSSRAETGSRGKSGGSNLDPKRLGSLVKKGPFMAKSRREGSSVDADKDQLGTPDSRMNTNLSGIFGDRTPVSGDNIIVKPHKHVPPPMYVNVQTLTKGMVFGLSDMFFDNQPSMSLVSNGAECISISKKLFLEHASHGFTTKIREDIYPYPSEEDLQANLEEQVVWDWHRRSVVTHVVNDIRWNRADKADARLDPSPPLGY